MNLGNSLLDKLTNDGVPFINLVHLAKGTGNLSLCENDHVASAEHCFLVWILKLYCIIVHKAMALAILKGLSTILKQKLRNTIHRPHVKVWKTTNCPLLKCFHFFHFNDS